jgi:hypothetical protein
MNDNIDDAIRSAGDSLFSPETLDDITARLALIAHSECNCGTTPHENALHDLAVDDVPVLLRVVERLHRKHPPNLNADCSGMCVDLGSENG